MILLKAREAAPKRGYYYRSWMNVVYCVQMGKDLGLDEHESEHAAGRPCGYPRPECLLRSRIWQTVFVVEAMIGTPQGKRQAPTGSFNSRCVTRLTPLQARQCLPFRSIRLTLPFPGL
jgi:hypothetical protein